MPVVIGAVLVMDQGLKSYICRYESGGAEHSCRIDASSAEEAAAIMKALPWGEGSGPVGEPRRHYPQLDMIASYAALCLRHVRHLMGREAAAQEEAVPVRQSANGS